MPEYRDPPAVDPRPFGLFSVESPTNKGDGPWSTGAQWEVDACALVLNYANALCSEVGTNEVQTVTITGTPAGGFFTLTFFDQTTANIARNATAGAVETALEALPNLEPADVTVTGGPGPGTPYVVTFSGQWAAENVPQMSAAHTFTGGTAPTIAVTTGTPGVRTPKVNTAPAGTKTADPFSVYVIRECRTVGEMSRSQAAALRMLTLNEERAVEKELWARIIAAAPTNATPATPPTPEIGLALLEEAIAQNYVGRPVIHVSVDLGSILATRGAIEGKGNTMQTKIGSKVVIGAGYPRTGVGGAPAAGTEWMHATGGLFVERSTSPTLQGPYVVQAPLDNTQVVLAERTYVAGFDCVPVATRVTFP
jgi:hypothetical protein